MIDKSMFDLVGRVICPIGIVFGSLFFVGGLCMLGFSASSYSKMETAEGTIVKYEKGRDGMRGPGPFVEFIVDGQPYIISGKISSENGGRGFPIGDKAEVLYDPENPSDGVMNFFLDKWFGPTLFTGVGFFIALISTLLAVTNRKKSNESPA